MPIIRITKQDVEKAQKAKEEALKKDPEFKSFQDEMEKLEKKAEEQWRKEAKQ